MKKSISILLILCLLLSCAVICANAAPEQLKCFAAGNETELFGIMWDSGNTDNLMEYSGDNTYSKTYTATAEYEDVQVRVYNDDDTMWYGDESGNALRFNIVAPGDFTISFNTVTKAASVSGDNIYDYNNVHYYEPFYVFGNGSEDWLNNAAGSAVIEENLMTEVAENIFCLRTNVTEGSGREFRVSYCGNMNFTFGGSFEDYGVWTDAAFNGKPVSLDIGKEVSKLCIFLDMREFDMATKEGARFGAVALAEGERFRLPKNTFKNEFDKKYMVDADEDFNPEIYNELYVHLANDEIDWVLVHASNGGPEAEWIICSVLGDRILNRFSGGNPFEYDYAVYDVKKNRFFNLESVYDSGKYPGLPEALDELNIGRLRGDIDNDGALTIQDATELQRCLAEFISFPYGDRVEGFELPQQSGIITVFISDMNQDGVRDIRDVTEIQRRLAGF